jgi:hypothetical protein
MHTVRRYDWPRQGGPDFVRLARLQGRQWGLKTTERLRQHAKDWPVDRRPELIEAALWGALEADS